MHRDPLARRARRAALLALLVLVPAAAVAGSKRPVSLPPSEAAAQQRLETSPRHGEYSSVAYEGGTPIRTWISFPERRDRAGVVLIISEIYGLSDWIRGVADQLAADGFVAVAPDLISGLGPNGGGTESVSSRDSVVALIRSLTPEETARRVAAVREHALQLPASNGKYATIGFCWGGSRSFEAAAAVPAPAVAIVYYGASPDSATLLRVTAPVVGHYAGDDARVNGTIDRAKAALAAKNVAYGVNVYDGAGHGFLRQQDARDGANLRASQRAWPRTIEVLRARLR